MNHNISALCYVIIFNDVSNAGLKYVPNAANNVFLQCSRWWFICVMMMIICWIYLYYLLFFDLIVFYFELGRTGINFLGTPLTSLTTKKKILYIFDSTKYNLLHTPIQLIKQSRHHFYFVFCFFFACHSNYWMTIYCFS